MAWFGTRKRLHGQGWTLHQDVIGPEPVLVTGGDFVRHKPTTRDEQFLAQYAPGSQVTCQLLDPDGIDTQVTLTVDRVRKTLRAAWPQARFGYTVFFAEFAEWGRETTFELTGHRKYAAINLDAAGVTLHPHRRSPVVSAPWTEMVFSNGPQLRLLIEGSTVDIEPANTENYLLLEHLLTKFGHFKQLHF